MGLWNAIKFTGTVLKGTYQVTKATAKVTEKALVSTLDATSSSLGAVNKSLAEYNRKSQVLNPFMSNKYIAELNILKLNGWRECINEKALELDIFFDRLITLNHCLISLYKNFNSNFYKYEEYIESAKELHAWRGFCDYSKAALKQDMSQYQRAGDGNSYIPMSYYLENYSLQINAGSCLDDGIDFLLPDKTKPITENIKILEERISELESFLNDPTSFGVF